MQFEGRGILKLTLIVTTAGLAAYGGAQIQPWVSAQVVSVGRPIPYTVILRETVHHPDGSVTVPSDVTWAVRSDGSIVRRITHREPVGDVAQPKADGSSARAERSLAGAALTAGATKNSERVVQLSSGIEVAINELADLKSTTMVKDGMSATWQRDPQSQCINSMAGKRMTSLPETIVGLETVAGYRAVRIKANKEVTFWFALDYGCAMVRSRWDFGGQEFSEKALVALIPGEPDATLFHVPEDAKEVPPSERFGRNSDCSGCSERTAGILRRLDADYLSRRAVK